MHYAINFSALCDCDDPFTANFLYNVLCECLDSVVSLRHYLHSHLYMAHCQECLPGLSDLDVHTFGPSY